MKEQFDKSEQLFIKKMLHYQDSVVFDNKTVLLKFLNEREQQIVKELYHNNLNVLHFYGGFEKSKRKRLALTNFTTIDHQITCICISYNKRYLTLHHRLLLGTLMSLGISRESIGDICIGNETYFFVCNDISSYILKELKLIKNVPVTLKVVTDYIIDIEDHFSYNKYFVTSLRIDLVLAKILDISRKESLLLLTNNIVRINQKTINNRLHLIKTNDEISVQRYGKYKIFDTKNTTKKQKIVLEVGKYV